MGPHRHRRGRSGLHLAPRQRPHRRRRHDRRELAVEGRRHLRSCDPGRMADDLGIGQGPDRPRESGQPIRVEGVRCRSREIPSCVAARSRARRSRHPTVSPGGRSRRSALPAWPRSSTASTSRSYPPSSTTTVRRLHELLEPNREVGVVGRGEFETGQRILTMSVETRRDDHPVRREPLHHRSNDLVDRLAVHITSGPGGKRQIQIGQRRRPVRRSREATGARIQRRLVERHVQHPRIVVEDVLGCRCRRWTSQSTIATRSPRSDSARAATATLLKRQKPIGSSDDRVVARVAGSQRRPRRTPVVQRIDGIEHGPDRATSPCPTSPARRTCRHRCAPPPSAQTPLDSSTCRVAWTRHSSSPSPGAAHDRRGRRRVRLR